LTFLFLSAIKITIFHFGPLSINIVPHVRELIRKLSVRLWNK